MRFVLANRHLIAAGGTEVHLVTITEHLQRLGHEVVVYAPELGAYAGHARRRGIEVVDDVGALPAACDVVFAQDTIVVYELAERYPDALLVFRICGDVFDFQLAPQLDGVVDLFVVLSDRYERVALASAASAPVLRLRVPIDVDRLVPLGALRERPERAVMLGNYGEREALVRATWSELGVEVTRVGGDAQTYDVAAALADADIVVAKSRAALDAMACGRAVYVYDFLGGDGWVTPSAYAAMEADMFAGQATDRVIDAPTLRSDLASYTPQMGVSNRDLVLQHHGARDHVIALLAAIGERGPRDRSPAPMRELARLVALQWSWELTAREFRSMHWPLREHAAQSEQRSAAAAEVARQASETARLATEEVARVAAAADGAIRAREQALEGERLANETARLLRSERDETLALLAGERTAHAELRARMDAMRATRMWRLAERYWRVKRRLRG